jgi:L-xylulokinase
LLRDIDRPRLARLAGGPARSNTWVKMYADTLGMPVEVVKVSEMGALGAAMCASVAAGAHTDLKSAAEHMVVTGDAIEPDPAVSAAMSDKYELYVETLGKLKEG